MVHRYPSGIIYISKTFSTHSYDDNAQHTCPAPSSGQYIEYDGVIYIYLVDDNNIVVPKTSRYDV